MPSDRQVTQAEREFVFLFEEANSKMGYPDVITRVLKIVQKKKWTKDNVQDILLKVLAELRRNS